MRCRGIRGAITVEANSRKAIVEATRELLQEMITRNGVNQEDVVCILFTTTPDLDAEFPAVAARQMGWTEMALLCGHEMKVPGSLPHCLRVLLLVNTEKKPGELFHIYLKEAQGLRAGQGGKG